METLLIAVLTQTITFIPLALGISISYTLLRATDMTLDGSFVLGAALFARLVTLGFSPGIATLCALLGGAAAGVMVSLIQRGGKVDSLLAGVLATFILTSINLIIMGRPNINLLYQSTLFSSAFSVSELHGWLLVSFDTLMLCISAYALLRTRFGLLLRAVGDNSSLLKRMGKPVETYRLLGFAFTNTMSAASGILTAQTVGYADVNMGLGMTLTGIGAIILGQQLIKAVLHTTTMRTIAEFSSCLVGVILYFLAMNMLLRFDINPIYLKMILGLTLIIFLRTAVSPMKVRTV